MDPVSLDAAAVTSDAPPKLVWATDEGWQATSQSASVCRVCTCWTVAHFRPTIQPPGDPAQVRGQSYKFKAEVFAPENACCAIDERANCRFDAAGRRLPIPGAAAASSSCITHG